MFTKERVMIIKKDFTLQNYTHTYINSKYSWLLSQEIFLGWLFSQEKDNILVEISNCLCIYLILINYPNFISFTDFFPPTDHSFLTFPPSIITSAAVAASRLRLHLCPSWTPLLIKVTSYTWEQIAPCVNIMLRYEKLNLLPVSDVKCV